jgi:hypothetical protein
MTAAGFLEILQWVAITLVFGCVCFHSHNLYHRGR